MPQPSHPPSLVLLLLTGCLCILPDIQTFRADEATGWIIASDVEGTANNVTFVNTEVKADRFYNSGFYGSSTIIANVEAGHVWGGHEVFDRSYFGLPNNPSLKLNAAPDPELSPQLGEYDYHATMVGHVLAGTGHIGEGDFGVAGMGMAPLADLWSGAIATHFQSNGSFSISNESLLTPYVGFFEGIAEGTPDVINSSWGFSGAGNSSVTQIIDALASQNATVASVTSAGNSGPDPGTVGEFANGHNSIVVGALEAASTPGEVMGPTDFSSRGPVSFYNPVTDELIENARVAVHIAAPGENMFLAAYLGDTGGLTGHSITEETPSTDLYFSYNMSGTSFSSPVVAGGIALLKDVGNTFEDLPNTPEAMDTRVMRSVLMAGASATPGWDNGQQVIDGSTVTTQALDFATGAGALDLDRSLDIYALGTSNLPGTNGGEVTANGWDFGSLGLGTRNDYVLDTPLEPYSELTIALNWFLHREFDPVTLELVENTARFSDLNLEVWSLQADSFHQRIASSESLYNNTEFLRIVLEDGGSYGFRVLFDDIIYDDTSGFLTEDYAVAWSMVIIPEPVTLVLALILLSVTVLCRPRRRK